jgi:hypothetical protein
MEQQPIVPPRAETESHEAYMSNFINLLVNTTKNASDFTKLEDDAQKMFIKIITVCRETMLKAARTRHSAAVIFMYCINRSNGIYDLLFPTGNIAAQMEKHNITPVFTRIQHHMTPLEIEHKIYEVYDGDVVEVINHTGQLILPDDVEIEDPSESLSDCEDNAELPDIIEEEPEGVKKLKPVRRHIGVISVSWESQITDE